MKQPLFVYTPVHINLSDPPDADASRQHLRAPRDSTRQPSSGRFIYPHRNTREEKQLYGIKGTRVTARCSLRRRQQAGGGSAGRADRPNDRPARISPRGLDSSSRATCQCCSCARAGRSRPRLRVSSVRRGFYCSVGGQNSVPEEREAVGPSAGPLLVALPPGGAHRRRLHAGGRRRRRRRRTPQRGVAQSTPLVPAEPPRHAGGDGRQLLLTVSTPKILKKYHNRFFLSFSVTLPSAKKVLGWSLAKMIDCYWLRSYIIGITAKF
jgi:hypothetical protein